MSDDLKTLVAQEVAKQLAAITADQTTKKVLDYLKANGGGNYKVIEEWHEGTEWYRKWSSGLIEQGGKLNNGATKTLEIPFTDTSFKVMFSPNSIPNRETLMIALTKQHLR